MIDLLIKEETDAFGAFVEAIVRGETYGAKEQIKAAGFRYGYPFSVYVKARDEAETAGAGTDSKAVRDWLDRNYAHMKCWSLYRRGTAAENAVWLDELRAGLGLNTEPGSAMNPGEVSAGPGEDDIPF